MIFLVLIHLDAGHGGKDGGAAANGLKEKDIVLDICQRIQKGLGDYQDVRVTMSRSTDIYLSLDERTTMANAANADVLLSVHINAATNPAARGFESFIYPNSGSPTSAFQNVMHNEIVNQVKGFAGFDDRGKKQANFHMLRMSKMKAVLTENFFITNPADAAMLANAEFRQRIAQGHINGLERFLGLKKSAQPPPASDKLYTVQVGAFEHRENADAMANDLRKLGYRPFVKYE